jgi:hypothetical protein
VDWCKLLIWESFESFSPSFSQRWWPVSSGAVLVVSPPGRFADHNEFSQLYGFIVMPVAICFCIYALRTYIRRCAP